LSYEGVRKKGFGSEVPCFTLPAGSCRACRSVTDLATKATLLNDWMLHFLTEFWFEPLRWYSPRKLVNWGLCWFDYMAAMVLAGAGTLFV